MSAEELLAECEATLQWLGKDELKRRDWGGVLQWEGKPPPLNLEVKQRLRRLLGAAVWLGEPPVSTVEVGRLPNLTMAVALVQRLRAWTANHKSVGQPAAEAKSEANSGQGQPAEMLTNWREITTALGLAHGDQNKVKSLNRRFDGPIPKAAKGKQPIVRKDTLIEWWNNLAVMEQDLANQREGARLSAEARYNYGRKGTVAPEIGGGVKKRRHTKT